MVLMICVFPLVRRPPPARIDGYFTALSIYSYIRLPLDGRSLIGGRDIPRGNVR
jgi:hypothetical protein